MIERTGVTSKLKQIFGTSILESLARFFQVGHPRLNRHTLKIIHAYLSSHQISLSEMMSHKILRNTNLLLTSMLKNRQEWSLEIMLDILLELLTYLNDVVKKAQEDQIVEHI